MIATYIQELLATNNRVIVPNYGAFLVRATSKSKDANNLEEKLKDIYFSPFLKFNDELLEKYIIKKDNVTKEQAAEKIKQFIEDIKLDLGQEKPYIIKGFGQFVADKQGKVQFVTITKPVQPESDKKTASVAKEEKKVTAKSTIKKPAATKSTEVASKKVDKKNIAQTDKPEKKQAVTEAKKEDKTTSSENKLKEFKPEKEEKKADVTIAKEIKKPIPTYKTEKKTVNKSLVWSIAIGLPIAAIFIWAILNYNTVKKVYTKYTNKTEQVTKKKTVITKKPVKKTTEAIQTKSTSEEGKKETKEKNTKPVIAQKKYYIIAGSFKNEKYAASYLAKLQTEGYNAEKLTKRNGMYAVSYNSFADKRKAIAEYKFLVQEKQLQAWILYY